MTFWTLVRRSLRYHARAHLGVVVGAAIATAALTGALVVGDSVRGTLRERALARLGGAAQVLFTGDRPFQTDLPGRMLPAGPVGGADVVLGEALLLQGVVSRADGTARANRVQVLGVDDRWPGFSRAESTSVAGDSALLNETLARQLGVRPGEEIILRVRKPVALGLDAAVSPRDEQSVALRLKVRAVAGPAGRGDFSLTTGPAAPANLFLPLELLGKAVAIPGRANLALFGPVGESARGPGSGGEVVLARLLREHWVLEDAGLSVHVAGPSPPSGGTPDDAAVEISSSRVFLDRAVIAAAPAEGVVPVLTYLANLIRVGDRAVPYSMVTAAGGPYLRTGVLPDGRPDPGSPLLRDDEVLVNQWLADDLKLKPGDALEMSYFVPDSGSRLLERTNSFKVRGVVPLAGPWGDRSLMPDFPGVARAESTSDWDTGFPLTYKIRPQDEAYWKARRGTPKAFVTLQAGQRMWANRFGSLTALRYRVPGGVSPDAFAGEVQRALQARLDPAELGFRVDPVRRTALAAADQAQDFGQLFLGFSFFLVAAALVLMALLFQFSLEQRVTEVGTLLALGFTPGKVRRLLLAEGFGLVLGGSALGLAGGPLYARGMLWALAHWWRAAVGSEALEFHCTLPTLVAGALAGSVVGGGTLWFALRKQASHPVAQLLAGTLASRARAGRPRSLARFGVPALAVGGGLAALGLAWCGAHAGGEDAAESFFCGGALGLVAGLAACAAWLGRLAQGDAAEGFTLASLGLRGCARRCNRSLATVAMVASGTFLVVSMGVFRLDATKDAADRRSGTGGFALLAESTLPVPQDLDTVAGRDAWALEERPFAQTTIVSLRVRAGDEASCLNLNRAQRPRLLGVKPGDLTGRFTLTGVAKGLDVKRGWDLLRHPAPAGDEPIPAIGDASAIEWGLGKSLGDTLDFTDESGRGFQVKLVAGLANSIFQGGLLIDESEFVKRFPGEGGWRFFLVDAPPQTAPAVSVALTRGLQDAGLEVVSTAARLNTFNAVQNTYLDTFQLLGGLGLVLGCAGLGVVVARNVLERRGELGLMTAVGFAPRVLVRLVVGEHAVLLAWGLLVGGGAAGLAVFPSLLAPGSHGSWLLPGLLALAVLANGLACAWLAARYALRGRLLAALRGE